MIRRRGLRLRGFDYSTIGLYLVTVCTHQRRCTLGGIEDDAVVLSAYGEIVSRQITLLPARLAGVAVDVFVVMPNHVHAILGVEARARARARQASPLLGSVVGAFKSGSAREINALGRTRAAVWQRGFHDRIVRDEEELGRIQEYIATNPIRWALDPNNPVNDPAVERL